MRVSVKHAEKIRVEREETYGIRRGHSVKGPVRGRLPLWVEMPFGRLQIDHSCLGCVCRERDRGDTV